MCTVYDWVCEIGKLSDVATEGWPVQYSQTFLDSISEHERSMVLGTEDELRQSKQKEEAAAAGSSQDGGRAVRGTVIYRDDDDDESLRRSGWDGAVVAVLGLFDKGKTFVLNHLTESQVRVPWRRHCCRRDLNSALRWPHRAEAAPRRERDARPGPHVRRQVARSRRPAQAHTHVTAHNGT